MIIHIIAEFLLEGCVCRLYHIKDAFNGFIQYCFVQLTRTHRCHNLLIVAVIGAGHLQFQAGFDRLHAFIHGTPIRHDQPLVAPFFLEDFGHQVGVIAGIGAVDAVIGAHHRPGLRFPDRNLKAGQVNFTQGTLIQD